MYSDLNPTDKPCWKTCVSCFRCSEKGRYGSRCEKCSGRSDPDLRREPDPDDICRCNEGILQYKTQNGRLLVAKLPGNPYKNGGVIQTKESQDERDYQAQLALQRERSGREDWDPIQFEGGASTDKWYRDYMRGK